MPDVQPPGQARVWITAVRPFAYTASVLAVLLGAAIAFNAGYPVQWIRFVLTLIGVVCFHTAANLLNDCFDHRRGLDTEVLPTSGAIVRGWLSERQVFRAAMAALVVGVVCGFVLTVLCGWFVLGLGVAGTVICLTYTRSGFCLKYNGLGDAGILAAFSVLPVLGTYWVQSDTFHWQPVLWSLPLGSYTVAILHANNWRDIERDRASRCVTPAGLLGSACSALYYQLLILGPYGLVAATIGVAYATGAVNMAPLTAGAVVLSLPLALALARISPERNSATFAMLDGRTAQLHMAFGVLLTAGFFAGRLLSA